jgi:hypothetical protein
MKGKERRGKVRKGKERNNKMLTQFNQLSARVK